MFVMVEDTQIHVNKVKENGKAEFALLLLVADINASVTKLRKSLFRYTLESKQRHRGSRSCLYQARGKYCNKHMKTINRESVVTILICSVRYQFCSEKFA